MRLGFPVHVFGAGGLPAHDARPWYEHPDLSVGLVYLADILAYLRANSITMYRMHSALLPTSQDPRATRDDLARCGDQLRHVARLAREADVRLSVHAPTEVVLNSPNADRGRESRARLESLTGLLDALECDADGVVVVHVGGVFGDRGRALDLFCANWERLSARAQSRIALEHDDRLFSLADALVIHQRCGTPLVFDNLHHRVLNPEGLPMHDALERALATWDGGAVPKMHFSSPRTELRSTSASGLARPPTWTQHSDLANPFEFADLMRSTQGLRPFDVMLEARGRDLAVVQLRRDLARFAPDVAAQLR